LEDFYRSTIKDRDDTRRSFAQVQRQIARLNSTKSHLGDHGWGVFSQGDEDGILNFLTIALNLSQPKCLELGAGNFSECNFRGLLETANGSGVFVDFREDLVSSISRTTASYLGPALGVKTWITPENVEELVSSAREELDGLDFISLDLDGNDYWVAERIDFSQVKLVVLEVNPVFGEISTVSVPRDDSFDRRAAHFSHLYWGTSISAYTNLMGARGFKLIGFNQKRFNAFFLKEDEVARSPVLEELAANVAIDFSDWQIREGRSSAGDLTLAQSRAHVREFPDLPLIDVSNGNVTSVGALDFSS